nr:hypothetical protein [Helicobacter pylori]
MTMRFDHNNNNNSEECQMFFDKINNGSPYIVTGAFEDDIKLSIKHSQWRGYPKVFDIEKIEA